MEAGRCRGRGGVFRTDRRALAKADDVNWIQFGPQGVGQLADAPPQLLSEGFLWLDAKFDHPDLDSEGLRWVVQRLAGARIHELHLQDAINLQHPSYFDSTREYEMLIFRKLSTGEAKPLEER